MATNYWITIGRLGSSVEESITKTIIYSESNIDITWTIPYLQATPNSIIAYFKIITRNVRNMSLVCINFAYLEGFNLVCNGFTSAQIKPMGLPEW